MVLVQDLCLVLQQDSPSPLPPGVVLVFTFERPLPLPVASLSGLSCLFHAALSTLIERKLLGLIISEPLLHFYFPPSGSSSEWPVIYVRRGALGLKGKVNTTFMCVCSVTDGRGCSEASVVNNSLD